jgi:sarcosine oxidase
MPSPDAPTATLPTLSTLTADVVVVGLGAWGSQALWRLATRGVDVLGVERFGIGHPLGSTHGSTRLFRVACLEHPGLVPIAQRARDLWYELGDRTGQVLLRQTGGLMAGPPGGHVVGGTLASATAAHLDVEVLDRAEVARRFPSYAGLQPDDIGVWDPGAGICYPERGVRAAVAAAEAAGARVLRDTRVVEVTTDEGGVTARTSTALVGAGQVVLSAGAWMPHFVDLPITARRMPMFWFEGPHPADTEPGGRFDLDGFPVFIREIDGGHVLWGHGARKDGEDEFAVKIGMEDHGDTFLDTDADQVDRSIRPERDYGLLSELVGQAFPGIVTVPAKAVPCMVTNSADRQFVIGRPGGDPRLVVATGDSGHGFKHAPAIGELLAQITVGEEPFADVGFLSPDREYAAPFV